jgi:hypothetical protein
MCRVLSEAKGSFVQVAKADVALTCNPACATGIGNQVKVTVQGHFTLLTPILAPFLGGSNVTLTSSASARVITEPPPVALGPTPTPTPTPSPSPSPATPSPSPTGTGPTPSPTASPTPTPTPVPCFAPVANFTVSPTGGFVGTVFQFTDSSQWMPVGSCGTNWVWNFGDGAGNGNGAGTSNDRNPTYVYSKKSTHPGFPVTLQVSNIMGTSTKTVIVTVN